METQLLRFLMYLCVSFRVEFLLLVTFVCDIFHLVADDNKKMLFLNRIADLLKNVRSVLCRTFRDSWKTIA